MGRVQGTNMEAGLEGFARPNIEPIFDAKSVFFGPACIFY
jgi:hypothetical protein